MCPIKQQHKDSFKAIKNGHFKDLPRNTELQLTLEKHDFKFCGSTLHMDFFTVL